MRSLRSVGLGLRSKWGHIFGETKIDDLLCLKMNFFRKLWSADFRSLSHPSMFYADKKGLFCLLIVRLYVYRYCYNACYRQKRSSVVFCHWPDIRSRTSLGSTASSRDKQYVWFWLESPRPRGGRINALLLHCTMGPQPELARHG